MVKRSYPYPVATSADSVEYILCESAGFLMQFDPVVVAATLGREQLSATRTYYVRADGSNSNTGLTDSAAGAFLTIQKAIDTVGALDISIYDVTIQVGAGTYTNSVLVGGPWVGTGDVLLVGDTTTPSNCVISTTSANAVTVEHGGCLQIKGFKITVATAGVGIASTTGSAVQLIGKMEFGAVAWYGLYVSAGGSIRGDGADVTISGGALALFEGDTNGSMRFENATWTTANTPAWGTACCDMSSGAAIACFVTWAGTGATGTRYSAVGNSSISTNGAGANYFPGDAAGTTTPDEEYS
jgi:hypothetical protein